MSCQFFSQFLNSTGTTPTGPVVRENATQRRNMRPPPKPTSNGYAYTNQRKSISDDLERPNSNQGDNQKIHKTSTTSTFGFSPPQNPFFEASFYTQRPPPSALITVNRLNLCMNFYMIIFSRNNKSISNNSNLRKNIILAKFE